MKKDALKQQEQTGAFQRLNALLKQVKPPIKSEPEWTVVENNLFAALQVAQPLREKPQTTFLHNFFNPFVVAPAAVTPLLLLSVFFYQSINSPVDPFTRAVSIHGKLIACSPLGKKIDTLSGIDGFSKIPNSGKNYTFKTLDNSSLIMRLDQGSVFELSQNSTVSFKEISRRHLLFGLDKGSILFKVSKRLKDQKFIISTPSASCIVVGTIFKVDVRDSSDTGPMQTVLTVYEGKVKFATDNQVVFIATGQTCHAEKSAFGAVRAISELETPIKDISVLELLVNRGNPPGAPYGFIDVTTQPDQALVIIDDSLSGKTPLLARKSIGRHSVLITANGYAAFEKAIEIGKDSISRLSESLKKMPSSERVSLHRAKHAVSPIVVQPESTLVAVPEYVEAMVQLTVGEYQKAVGILDSLKNNQPIDMKSRMSIMKKINSCYAKLGDFRKALERLEEKHEKTTSNTDKENLLWEVANMKANCMGDYQGAETALVELLVIDPTGIRSHDAYGKLAEIQYMLNKFESAAATYRKHISQYPNDPDMDKSLFSLANIIDNDMHNYHEALVLYTKLIKTYPHSSYFNASLFARAECLLKSGRNAEARNDLKKYLKEAPEGLWSPVCAQLMKELK
jgi:tetratricopeptide (TPR) repeat protein